MSIKLPDFLVAAGDSTEFLIEDKFVRGGLHIVAVYDDLATLDPTVMKVGMLCVTQDTNKIYQLKSNADDPDTGEKVPVWEEFKAGGEGGGVRQTVTHFVNTIPAGSTADFALPLGRTIIVYSLAVDTSAKVEVFETMAAADTNPYTFIATPDHLMDDGSTLMSDGTILRGRRYNIFTNQESASDPTTSINIYFRVTNTDVVEKAVTLTIAFLPIESI